MKALQAIAMGLLMVILDVRVAGWDLIADPLGWGLVVLGLTRMRGAIPRGTLLALAVLAGLVSFVSLDEAVLEALDPSMAWLISLLELAFDITLATVVAEVLAGHRPDLARRLRTLRWFFVVAAVMPVLIFGGGAEVLLVPVALVVIGTYVYYIYLLFTCSAPYEEATAPGGDGAGDGLET